MEAHEQSFLFLQQRESLLIPYFQRQYVWTEENWKELLENLLDEESSHFLGSIILKGRDSDSSFSVIDGQQRLTTLSILFRACCNILLPKASENGKIKILKAIDMLLYNTGFGNLESDIEVKISHSRIDADDYREIITSKDILIDKISLISECKKNEKPSSGIKQCYKYFYTHLSEEQAEKLYAFLTDRNSHILVVIDLGGTENEQAIFDTINSAGVRLSSADIIKNALFQKAEELATNQHQRDTIVLNYDKYWQKIFLDSEETIDYWSTEKKIGRYKKDNLELLLYCVAVDEKFFNPYSNKTTEMVKLYKEHIKDFDSNELYSFIAKISKYAEKYKMLFPLNDGSNHYSFCNDIIRLLHILEVADLSSMHPYILKLFMENDINSLVNPLPPLLVDEINLLEAYVIRHIICGVSNSNFNKVCYLLVTGRTVAAQIQEEAEDINDDVVKQKLLYVANKEAKLVLFWIELWLRKQQKKDIQELTYTYQLEHLLPQKWEQYWLMDKYPVKNPYTNSEISEEKEAKVQRSASVYEIGNMTLLNGGLNGEISNYYIADKIAPEGKKRGLRYSSDLLLTREFLELYEEKKNWDEFLIRQRSNAIAEMFTKIWPIVKK